MCWIGTPKEYVFFGQTIYFNYYLYARKPIIVINLLFQVVLFPSSSILMSEASISTLGATSNKKEEVLGDTYDTMGVVVQLPLFVIALRTSCCSTSASKNSAGQATQQTKSW